MPGLELFDSAEVTAPAVEITGGALKAGVYYYARLDPKNYLEGPLSLNPATRLRQMLARPGIVVRTLSLFPHLNIDGSYRSLPVSVTVSAPGVHLKQASLVYTRGTSL